MEMAAASGSAFAISELEEANVPIPLECLAVWRMFNEISAARQSSGYGPQPLSYSEIEAYARLKMLYLSPEEVTLLRVADEAYLRVWSEMSKTDKGEK